MLLREQDLRQRIIYEAKKVAIEQFDVRRMIHQLETLYLECFGEKFND
jgi:hypothetical protein